ncbi:MAG: adenylosuccinate synthase [Gemmataceae bacterium]|nr:adenylosuccinate synthase [Gemmataceae bacterium]MDW8264001.1 adenylosuccinate synthase [Gemmataceae bacterium]
MPETPSDSRSACTCVVGLQWGDEAKGKIVDLLTEEHDVVVRYNGGANAGHTVVTNGQTYRLSLLPTGVLRPRLRSVIGNGVVIYPPRFLEEVSQLRSGGIPVGDNLAVSDHAHVIFPYHLEEERLSEQGSEQAIGTTGRGIGPCYADKVGRICGIRLGELLHAQHLKERLRPIVERKNRILRALSPDARTFDADALAEEYLGYGERMRPHITDTTRLLHRALREGRRILFEAAQGSLLDVDHGTFPYVTSSNSSPAGIWSGSGVPARNVGRVIGVVKAYTSRVGRGPFPTELNDGPEGVGERIRRVGREYGTVTGRPRRCGWLDAVATRYAAAVAGADELAVMLLDVLTGLSEVAICTAYELDGQRLDEFPGDAYLVERCRPVYETWPGWQEDISGARRLADLPTPARRYVDRIAELLNLPVRVISVGPDRQQTILC